MALADYEVELQTEIVAWNCCHPTGCVMEFVPKPRHIKLGMEGLLWSVEALPISINQYTFNIMDLKRSTGPRSLSYADQPQLPPKFELLLMGFKLSMMSVSKAEEALNKMYEFSRLFLRTEQDQRWWMIVDAEMAATACVAAREAVLEAAIAAAAILRQINSSSLEYIKFSFSRVAVAFEKEAIEGWTPADELWAMSFSDHSSVVRKRIEFLSKALERGDVLQWCKVRVIDTPHPCFEIGVELDQFLKGDDVVLRIGIFNHLAVRVRVSLNDNVDVVCSQEGVETQSSLGLGYLLPDLVRDYLRNNKNNADNVVLGLLRRVVEYLGLLRRKCVVCGSDRLLHVPPTSACDNICKARKETYEALIACSSKEEQEDGVQRREQYGRLVCPNTKNGRMGLERVLNMSVVESWKKEYEKEAGTVVLYGAAVRMVARKPWRKVAKAMTNTMLELGTNTMLELWAQDEYACGHLY